jgi:hypothetical protein
MPDLACAEVRPAMPVGSLLVVLKNSGSGAVLRFWYFCHDSSVII